MPIDITGLIAGGLDLAQDLGADIIKSAEIKTPVNPQYDPLAGTYTNNFASATGDVLVAILTAKRATGLNARAGDEKVIVPLANFAGVEVKEESIIAIEGVRREIVSFKIDPTKQAAIYILRQTGP